jgi:predicted O-methyltransferase YrrM
LSPGVYVDLAYELKEILYTVEETEDDVKEAKQNWETASEAEKNIAYEAYINILTEAIARVE